MPSLTRLDLWGETRLPPNLSNLTQLRWLGFSAIQLGFHVPRGPLYFIPGLPSLQQLQTVRICSNADWPAAEGDLQAFADWAAGHPTLKRLLFLWRRWSQLGPDDRSLLSTWAASLRQRCPALDISETEVPLWQEDWKVAENE